VGLLRSFEVVVKKGQTCFCHLNHLTMISVVSSADEEVMTVLSSLDWLVVLSQNFAQNHHRCEYIEI
jgi:hypothetical protein